MFSRLHVLSYLTKIQVKYLILDRHFQIIHQKDLIMNEEIMLLSLM